VLRCLSPRAAIDLVINANGDVLHECHSNCETVSKSSGAFVGNAVVLD
jgi:hypothetical protein